MQSEWVADAFSIFRWHASQVVRSPTCAVQPAYSIDSRHQRGIQRDFHRPIIDGFLSLPFDSPLFKSICFYNTDHAIWHTGIQKKPAGLAPPANSRMHSSYERAVVRSVRPVRSRRPDRAPADEINRVYLFPALADADLLVELAPQKRIGIHGSEGEVPEFDLDVEFVGQQLADGLSLFHHVPHGVEDVKTLMDGFAGGKPRILNDPALLIGPAPHPVAAGELLRHRHVYLLLVEHLVAVFRFCNDRQNQSVGGRSPIGDGVAGPVDHLHLDDRLGHDLRVVAPVVSEGVDLEVNRRLDHGRIAVTLDIVAKLALFHMAIL